MVISLSDPWSRGCFWIQENPLFQEEPSDYIISALLHFIPGIITSLKPLQQEKVGYLQCGIHEGQLAPGHICLLKTEGTNTSSLNRLRQRFPGLKKTSGSVKAAAKCKELGCEGESSMKSVGKGVSWEDVWLSPCHMCIACFRINANPKAASGSTCAWAEVGLDVSEAVLSLALICHNKQL